MESSWFMSYPHDVYARLRREAPVYWSERDGLWAISKYDDVRCVEDPGSFANGYHIYVAAARRAGRRRAQHRPARASPGVPSCARSRRSVRCTPTTS